MSIPKEGSRDIGDGIIISLSPDVCLTPVGSSTVPVPYSVFAYQSDDANTAATVRMTGRRAHTMASVVTVTKGDGPGSSGGVVSGTTGAACHPKGHSATVNTQGKPAVRHGDEWWMNNKNTVGKLTYIESTETFDETPAVLLTQNPEEEAPDPDVVASYRDAILGGMARAAADPMPEGSYQLAQALPQFRTDHDPSPRIPLIPNSMPSGRPPTGQPPRPANDTARPQPAQPAQPNRIAGQTTLHELCGKLGDGV